VVGEKTPWQVVAIHSGDWLLKTILIAVIVGIWRADGADKIARFFAAGKSARRRIDMLRRSEKIDHPRP
jgi:hypothetical protein